MARIPQEEIDRIKREVRVDELARARGIELRQHGENLVGRCIWHEDHDPSLIITPSKNLWHCMGACNVGGDVFAWVQKAEGVSFRHAYELLTGGAPVSTSTAKISTTPKLGSPLSVDMTDDELVIAYVEYCHDELLRKPEARSYLERRGVDSQEMIDRFRIGFANRTIGLRLPQSNRREGEELRSRLQKLGIYRDSGHEHFSGSIIVPIFDAGGRVVEIYGRKITPNLRVGTPLHTYLPGPHRGVWNLDALRESKEIILCEAAFDAMTFWCAGLRNVTWSYGVNGFTDEHLAVLKAYAIERVFIAYDRDDAGDRAAAQLAERLIGEGIDCYRVEFPKGMDANDYARKMTPADKALALAVRTATLIGKAHRSTPADAAPSLAAPIAAEEEASIVPFPSPQNEPPAELPIETHGEEIVFTFGDRTYRIRGVKKNTSFDSLRINVLLTRSSVNAVYLDTFDLSMARQRVMFEKQAAGEIGMKEEVVHREMGHILRALEEIRAKQIEELTTPKQKPIVVSESDRAAALEHLSSSDLVARTVEHITRCGIVGEDTNKLMAYLAAVSRKLDEPLAIIIQSSSAAGKTALMDAVLKMMPSEEQVRYSAVTGKSLFYISDETSLQHKVLAISEEEGAEQASYALKLLQSEGKLSIASTGKDPATGKLVTQEYHVEGPVMIFLTTTAIDIDEELLNRCIVLTVDEDREQTRAIHRLQREAQTIEGLLARRESDELRRLHQNAQRLLRPMLVANPYARELTFIDARTRTRRDHMKYLTLIRTIALLHQYQRPKQQAMDPVSGATVEYIEATLDDIALANDLAHQVLGRSLDELPPQTRKLLHLVDDLVLGECKARQIQRCDYRFSRKTVRDFTRWGNTQLKIHLHRLEELEYLLVHRGGRGQSFVYELLYDGRGKDQDTFLSGLFDVKMLNRSAREAEKSGSGRAHVGPLSAGSRTIAIDGNASADAASRESADEDYVPPLLPKPQKKSKSYTLRGGNGRSHEFRPAVLARRRAQKESD